MADSNDVNNIKTIQLSSSKDWKLWYAFILEAAKYAEVGNFVNLKEPDHARDLKEPEMPEPDDYTQAGKIEWEMKLAMWEIKIAEYEKIKRAMERINNLIWGTVSVDELRHCPVGIDVDVKDVIKALEARLAPTISSLRFDVRTRYVALCKPPKNQGLEKWLNQWSLIEIDINEAGMGGLFNPKIDFVNANLSIDSGYAQAWARDIHRDGDSIGLTGVINAFRERYKEMGILK
ncbi:hypothetical protein ACJ72_06760 [Emergomyces africanus]|uniref:Uncharacterized protein n=1 Tax=Emergomyces africanus TaxID=1955775 RepID=A0A1B7NQ77_9EURO|nr:hypothetical protein ACJ72_06760 [Emergomyces africanus]